MKYSFGPESAGYGTTWIRHVIEDLAGKKVFGEFAFVNPEFPEGILARRLRELTITQQQDALRYWFILNYSPAQATEQETIRPIDALDAVFSTRVDASTRITLAAELAGVSDLWLAKFIQPDVDADITVTASTALRALKTAAQQSESLIGKFGHNSASGLVGRDDVEAITAIAEQGLAAVAAGKLGEASGKDARNKVAEQLGKFGQFVAASIVVGLGKDLGDDIHQHFMLIWLPLLHALSSALLTMDNWLAWIATLTS